MRKEEFVGFLTNALDEMVNNKGYEQANFDNVFSFDEESYDDYSEEDDYPDEDDYYDDSYSETGGYTSPNSVFTEVPTFERHKADSVSVENCEIKFVENASLIGPSSVIPSMTFTNYVLDLSKVETEFVLVNAYSIGGVGAEYLFKDNEVIKPEALTGYVIKTSWIDSATAEKKLVIKFENTNFDELTDCNKTTGNFQIIRNAAE